MTALLSRSFTLRTVGPCACVCAHARTGQRARYYAGVVRVPLAPKYAQCMVHGRTSLKSSMWAHSHGLASRLAWLSHPCARVSLHFRCVGRYFVRRPSALHLQRYHRLPITVCMIFAGVTQRYVVKVRGMAALCSCITQDLQESGAPLAMVLAAGEWKSRVLCSPCPVAHTRSSFVAW